MTPEEKYKKRKHDSTGEIRKKFRWRHLQYETGRQCFIVDAKDNTPYTAYKWWEWVNETEKSPMVDKNIGLYYYYISQYIHSEWIPLILLPNEPQPFDDAVLVIKNWTEEIANNSFKIFTNDQKTGILVHKEQGPIMINVVLVHTNEPKNPYTEIAPEFSNEIESCTTARANKPGISFTVHQYITNDWIELIILDKTRLEESAITPYIEETLNPREDGVITFTNNCGSAIITNVKWALQVKPTNLRHTF